MARSIAVVIGLASASLLAFVPREASAETSAWATFSAGAIGFRQATNDFKFKSTLVMEGGVGTTPTKPFIFGGLFRVAPIIGAGTDLSLSLRGAMRSFQTGPFGLAIDAGGYLRTFGPTYSGTTPPYSSPTFGFIGGVILGGPLGSQLSILASAGQHHAYGVSATLGIDLLRLTLYRQSLLQWWPNPGSPSVPHTASGGGSQAAVDPARTVR